MADHWKCGDEFLPFHPDASHVTPDYRDGWNDCYRASIKAALNKGYVPLTPSPITYDEKGKRVVPKDATETGTGGG